MYLVARRTIQYHCDKGEHAVAADEQDTQLYSSCALFRLTDADFPRCSEGISTTFPTKLRPTEAFELPYGVAAPHLDLVDKVRWMPHPPTALATFSAQGDHHHRQSPTVPVSGDGVMVHYSPDSIPMRNPQAELSVPQEEPQAESQLCAGGEDAYNPRPLVAAKFSARMMIQCIGAAALLFEWQVADYASPISSDASVAQGCSVSKFTSVDMWRALKAAPDRLALFLFPAFPSLLRRWCPVHWFRKEEPGKYGHG
ncbi:hypothetical protein BC827DRAFT_1155994 [Russula dissimulans]|nr:hypothetical protein BC827DRAFT_1155994 [Russula dissimulans]